MATVADSSAIASAVGRDGTVGGPVASAAFPSTEIVGSAAVNGSDFGASDVGLATASLLVPGTAVAGGVVASGVQPMELDGEDASMGTVTVPPKELPPLKVTFYQLLIRQLQDDGFVSEAQSLSQHLNIQPDTRVERDAMLEAYGRSLKWAFGEEPQSEWTPVLCTPVPPLATDEKVLDFENRIGGVDDANPTGASKQPGGNLGPVVTNSFDHPQQLSRSPEVRLLYTAQLKVACRAATYSADGRHVAFGCTDGAIKILDCARMRACAASTPGPHGRMRITEEEQQKPIVRTLQDHVGNVTCLGFHPTNPTLFSGSLDKTVKIFDLTRPPGHKKAFSVLQDVHPVRSLCLHPCGDFLLVGTMHQAVRTYDLQTLNCFTAFHQEHHHGGCINDVRCSSDGRMFATASSDGVIKLWDGVSNRVVNRIPRAHSGSGVTSVRWSRNLRYLLSSGLDGRHRLWDLRRGQEVITIGFGPRNADYSTAVFAAGEKYVVAVSSNWRLSDAGMFDATTGSPVFTKLGLHQTAVHALDASPVDRTLVTGCDDEKGRFLSVEERGS
eukprot:TRINITY_DN50701_c0_g1_i1.p1 TRINITY_DN50701_c0_g1~~TRINITY_DN50701_c0_g1_i1.p1  ORF type:complete len:593 (+),score=96.80 TRINITY_DN50701_c0_g1_i1:116-1780(+)